MAQLLRAKSEFHELRFSTVAAAFLNAPFAAIGHGFGIVPALEEQALGGRITLPSELVPQSGIYIAGVLAQWRSRRQLCTIIQLAAVM